MIRKRVDTQGRYDLTILIPVYNEEATLLKILKRTSVLPIKSYQIIIVDDASRDKSSKIITKFLETVGSYPNVLFEHYKHPVNKGKGAAIQTGIKHAKGKYFIIQDADLEYNPKDIVPLLQYANKQDAGAVYGSRFMGSIKGMYRANYLANRFYNVLLRLLYGVKMTDMHTCYKLVDIKLLRSLELSANGFDYATELISKLLKNKVTIYELPVNFVARSKEEGKKINVMDGVECLYKLIRYRFTASDTMFGKKSTTFGRFLLVGVVGFLVNYGILVCLTQFNTLPMIWGEVVAAVVALQFTFLLHDHWTYQFQTPQGTQKLSLPSRYITYIASNSLSSLMVVVVFGFMSGILTRFPALLLAAVCGMVWNYIMNTYFIWRSTTD